MGEGAGALILESLAHARKRKARIYAEVAGYAATSEAYHMVIPREDGVEISATMAMALRSAGLRPAQVDYINAHATSTTHRRHGRDQGDQAAIQEAARRGLPSVRRNRCSATPWARPARWRASSAR